MTPLVKIGVLGAGSFGTVIAHLLSKKGHGVVLWGRSRELIDTINRKRENPGYLRGVALAHFVATTDLSEACTGKDMIVTAIPTQFIRGILLRVKDLVGLSSTLVNTAKGVEKKSLMLPSQIFEDCLGGSIKERYGILSGPTFALELVQGHPSGAAVASANMDTARRVQEWISAPHFRLYSGHDVTGVELGGALKNVMAIGTGIAEGLGFGLNTRAGLMTRCLNEMIRLGVKMGAEALTFSGLSGLGDLILTCTGDLSRNRSVGIQIGRGKKLADILKSMKGVAEGVATSASVHEISKKYGVEMPNAEYVYKILYENLSPQQAMKEILVRTLKEEMTGIE